MKAQSNRRRFPYLSRQTARKCRASLSRPRPRFAGGTLAGPASDPPRRREADCRAPEGRSGAGPNDQPNAIHGRDGIGHGPAGFEILISTKRRNGESCSRFRRAPSQPAGRGEVSRFGRPQGLAHGARARRSRAFAQQNSPGSVGKFPGACRQPAKVAASSLGSADQTDGGRFLQQSQECLLTCTLDESGSFVQAARSR